MLNVTHQVEFALPGHVLLTVLVEAKGNADAEAQARSALAKVLTTEALAQADLNGVMED